MTSTRISHMLIFVVAFGMCAAPADDSFAYDPMVFDQVSALVEQARTLSQEASTMKDAGAKRAQAQTRYEQAREKVADLRDEIKNTLEAFAFSPVLPPGDPRIALRQQTSADYLQAQLLDAAIIEESADVYEGEAKTKRLEEAEKKYLKMYENYRTRLAGLYARLYQGRCLLKLHKLEQVSEVLTDLLENPNEPHQFRALKVRAYPLAAEAWCDDSQRRYAPAIKYGESLLGAATAEELADDAFLKARLHLARAHKLQGDELASESAAGAAAAYRKAKHHAEFVAGREGEYQTQARELLAELEKALNR